MVGDAVQLEQAFLNLTLNAVEAMPQGGKLLIQARLCRKSAEESTRHVAIRFRDTGQGMSPEQTQRLFSSLLNTTKARGTGLGLAIVKRVIEQHSGRIRVWSRLGFGTAFLILLPVEQLTNSSQA